ncbi:MAG: hypothetical protein KDE27_31395 [Planctomycetes bacterium]|nr:hypothetical protein [Planctomycetota bacterium]
MKAPQAPSVALATPSGTAVSGGQAIQPMQETAGEQAQALGQAVGSLGQAAVRLGQAWQRDVDEAAVNGADSAMAEHLHQILDDANGGYMHAIGKDAIDRLDGTQQELKKVREGLMKGLTPNQAKVFKRVADARLERAMARVHGRAADQSRVYAAGEATGRLQVLAADAYKMAVSGDEEAASVALGTAKAQARRVAELNGYGPEQAAALVRKTTSSVHAMTITALIDRGQTDRAGELLGRAEKADEIDPAAANELGVAIERASVGKWGRQIADLYLDEIAQNMSTEASQATGLGERRPWMRLAQPGEELTAADEAMLEHEWKAEAWSRYQAKLDKQLGRGELTEAIYRSALAQGRDKFDQHEKQQAARYDAATTSAERFLLENKWASVDDIKEQLPAVYAQIEREPGGLARIAQFAQSRRYVTDPKRLLAFDAVPDTELAKMDAAELRMWMRGVTDDGDWGYVQARWKKAVGDATSDDDWLLKSKDYVEEAAKRSNVIPRGGRWSRDQEERYFVFKQKAQARFNEERDRLKAAGKEFSPEDAQRLMDEMALDVVEINSQSFWSSNKKVSAYALLPEQPPSLLNTDGRKAERDAAFVTVGDEDVYLNDLFHAGTPKNNPATKIAGYLKRTGQRARMQDVAELWVAMGKPGSVSPELQKFFDSPTIPEDERAAVLEVMGEEGKRADAYTVWKLWNEAKEQK